MRAARESAERAGRASEERVAAGRAAVTGWVNSVVSNVNAGNVGAPVLRAGPPEFAAFVDKNKPKLSDARLVASNVTDQSAEATAEWTAQVAHPVRRVDEPAHDGDGDAGAGRRDVAPAQLDHHRGRAVTCGAESDPP